MTDSKRYHFFSQNKYSKSMMVSFAQNIECWKYILYYDLTTVPFRGMYSMKGRCMYMGENQFILSQKVTGKERKPLPESSVKC